MIATTIKQSKRLIELGLSAKTADMCYIKGNLKATPYGVSNDEDCIPAWSYGALLEVISKDIVKDGQTYRLRGSTIALPHTCALYFNNLIDPDDCLITTGGDYIDAAYNMFCWKIENGYMKKEE